ncbi:hypothetical protein OHA18_26260 [Kribbella sp. NBC_00709]|uniref:hypothetical protein n=1 Tax=Kribbella sp. NBC_00709 TaxID=2975972 RepID=UPI002E2881A1|nr:hypothetical protein [Kribbella sp. NBC_00709]
MVHWSSAHQLAAVSHDPARAGADPGHQSERLGGRHRATGRAIPDLARVEAGLSGDDKVHVEVRIVVGADRRADDVGSVAHRVVGGRRLETATHRTPSVHLRIVEIDLEPNYSLPASSTQNLSAAR